MIFTTTAHCSQRARSSFVEFLARRLHSLVSLLIGTVLLLGAHPAVVGAPINYGSHTGTTVSYIDVTEEETTPDSVPLFGAPVFSADSIDFNPIGFDAAASGAAGTDTTGSRLTFMVEALPGKAITNISFSESGQTTLSGSGTDATGASVTAAGSITISEVDGGMITPVVSPIALSFTPSGGTYGLVSDGGGLPIFHTPWGGSLFIDLTQILTQESVPFSFGASKISIDLVNTLSATSEAGTHAVISKKDFGGISITVNIPEPATPVLATLAMAGFWRISRRGR